MLPVQFDREQYSSRCGSRPRTPFAETGIDYPLWPWRPDFGFSCLGLFRPRLLLETDRYSEIWTPVGEATVGRAAVVAPIDRRIAIAPIDSRRGIAPINRRIAIAPIDRNAAVMVAAVVTAVVSAVMAAVIVVSRRRSMPRS